MLKNCFLPVNYNKPNAQTCGEIVCENLKEFIINCKLCKIKIFDFEEFVQHFKNVHLDEKNEEPADRVLVNGPELEEKYERIIKFEITEAVEHKKSNIFKNENDESSGENEEFLWDIDNNVYSDDNKDEINTEDDEGHDADEEHCKSIIRKNRKPKELACEICSKKYADSRRLQLHIKIVHLREKPYKCSLCEQAFAEERSLKNHIGRKHTGYECLECHKNFTTNRNLKRHMLIHLDKKEFLCTEDNCGKAFATKGQLKDHQRYHNSEMFICEECGYKCRQRESLIVHKRHHTGEKPFGCKLCDRRFGSKPLLNEHMATHETERKHVCDVCGKSFNRPKALYHHKHLHLGIKKFVCKICGQAYAQAAGLSAHTRKHREDGAAFTTDVSSDNNVSTKTCGEIICQNETSFTIICTFCSIKMFEFSEFVRHFRNTHWPDLEEANKILKEFDVNQKLPIQKDGNKQSIHKKYDQQLLHEQCTFTDASGDRMLQEADYLSNENEDDSSDMETIAVLKKKIKSNKRMKQDFKCTLCNNVFTNKSHYETHSRKHKNDQFKCGKCDKIFIKEVQLAHHIRTHNGYSCKNCGRVFKSYDSLRYHKETHIETKNFVCDFDNCSKAFVNKRRLNAHKRIHCVDTFICEVCGSRQRNKQALADHIRKHTGEKPFACNLCDRRFTSNSLMNEHKACHETERKHICDVCGKSFNRQKALYHHKPLHLGIKKFVCKLCGAAYAQAAGLSAHMRKHKVDKISTVETNSKTNDIYNIFFPERN